MPSITVFPDPDPETSTTDGGVARILAEGTGETWANIRSGAGTEASDTKTTLAPSGETSSAGYRGGTTTTTWHQNLRSIFLFDTSAIGVGSTINSATLSLFGSSKLDESGSAPSYNIYTSTPNSNTALVSGDYGQFGTVAQATAITQANISTTEYNDWALNSTGLTNISKTGISKFGLRTVFDADNTAPTWGSAQVSRIVLQSADTAGTANDPKLVVIYTLVAGGGGNLTMLGVG